MLEICVTTSPVTNSTLAGPPCTTATCRPLEPVFWLFSIKDEESRYVPDLVYTVCCVVVLLFGLVSNTASASLLVKESRHGSISTVNKIYGNLLVADFLVVVGFLPLEIFWTETRDSVAVCRVLKFFSFTAFYATALIVILLATDRFTAISKPLKHLTNRYRQAVSISLWSIWLLSVTVGLWQAFVHHVGPHKDVQTYNLCGAEKNIATSIFTPVTALFCVLPFLFTLTINLVISIKLIRRQKNLEMAGCPACRLQGGSCDNHYNINNINRDKTDLPQLMKMKSVRVTIVVAFSLFMSQAPICIIYTWAWNNPNNTEGLNPIFFELSKICQYMYPCLVPLLHGSLIQRYQHTNTFRLSFSRHSSIPYIVKQ